MSTTYRSGGVSLPSDPTSDTMVCQFFSKKKVSSVASKIKFIPEKPRDDNLGLQTMVKFMEAWRTKEKKVVLEERRKLGRDVLNESPLEDSNYSEL